MAETFNSFLVGIGYDYDDKGAKEIASGMDGIKSKALAAGAVIAGAFGAGALASQFADAKNELGDFSEVFGVLANDVYGLGMASKQEGGSLESLMGQIEGLERIIAAAHKGDFSIFEAAGISGADASVIMSAKNATEAFIALADQFQAMTPKQRLNAADAFGLDESSIRLLSHGSNGVRDLMQKYQEIRPVTDEMTGAAKEYNNQIDEMQANIGGLADKLSFALLPSMTDAVEGMNDWIEVNRALINQNLDSVLDNISAGMGALAASGALLAGGGLLAGLASMAKNIPLIGGGLAAIAGSASSIALVAGAGAGGYAAGSMIYDSLDSDTQNSIGRGVAQTLAFFGNDEAQAAIAAENRVRDVSSKRERPIVFEFKMDGKIIERKVHEYNENENQRTLEELTSAAAG